MRYPRRYISGGNSGGMIGGFVPVKGNAVIALFVLGIAALIMLVLGGIFIWPYLIENAVSDASYISMKLLLPYLIVDLVISSITAVVVQHVEGSEGFVRSVRDSWLFSTAASLIVNIILACFLSLQPVNMVSFCANGLAILSTGATCALMTVLPSLFGAVLVGPVFILLEALIKSVILRR